MIATMRTSSTSDKANTFTHQNNINVNPIGKETIGRGPWKPREEDKGLADEHEEERDLSKLKDECEKDRKGVFGGLPRWA